MKLKDLLNARKIIVQHKDDKLNPALAYKFVKFIKASDSEEAFYNDKLKQIIEEYALKDEEGKIATQNGNIRLQPSKIGAFNKDFEEVQNTEVEKPNVEFSLKELELIEVSISEMYLLDEFIKE